MLEDSRLAFPLIMAIILYGGTFKEQSKCFLRFVQIASYIWVGGDGDGDRAWISSCARSKPCLSGSQKQCLTPVFSEISGGALSLKRPIGTSAALPQLKGNFPFPCGSTAQCLPSPVQVRIALPVRSSDKS